MSFEDLCCFFLIYSFFGWVIEVVFHAVTLGKIMNRGFLNGPVCPVYGFGMAVVLLVYNRVGSDNFFVVFLEGIILTTTVELIAGFILNRFFHARWWDYSDMPLNLNGYICPAFSIIWGLAVVFAVKLAHPAISAFTVGIIPTKILVPVMIFFYAVLITDTVATASSLIGLNRKLAELDRIGKAMRNASDRLTEKIGTKTIKTTQSAQEARVQAALGKAELEKHAEEIRASITKSRHFGAGRMLNVFPNVKHRDYKEIVADLQKRLHSI